MLENLSEISKLLMTDYYDALYQKSIDKYHFENRVFYENIEEGSEKIISFSKYKKSRLNLLSRDFLFNII